MIKLRVILVILFCSIIGFQIKGQQIAQFSVRYYTSTKGLSNNSVNALATDYKGNLWIGTEDGLNRFDGKSFKVYRNNRCNPSSIAGNFIRCLFFDRDSTLWIGTTGGGLSRYDRKTDSFRNFGYIDKDSSSLSLMDVSAIFQDRAGDLWIGTDGGGLNKYNPGMQNFIRYNKIRPCSGGLSSGKILDISEESNGNLILATWDGGLNIFNKTNGRFVVIQSKSGKDEGLVSNNVWSIHSIGKDQFLLGFFMNGVQSFNSKTKTFRTIPFPKTDINPLVYSIIHVNEKEIWFGTSIGIFYTSYHFSGEELKIDLPLHQFNDIISFQLIHDKRGSIWAANIENGFMQIHPQNSFFHVVHLALKSDLISTSNIIVNAICEDSKGKILLGTGEGLFLYNPHTQIINFSEVNSCSTCLNSTIKDMQKDAEGNIWVARNYDMAKFNPNSGQIESCYKLPKEVLPYARQGYNVIYPDGDGIFWLATGNGLYYLDKKTNKVETIIDANYIYMGNNMYRVISLDSDKENLYAGTHGGGMVVVNKKTRVLKILQNNPANSNSITDNHINQVYVDRNDSIWVITNNGLDRFNKKTNDFKHYNTKKFQDQYFKAIIEDEHRNLWISSNDGISKFNPSTGKVTNYYFYNQVSQTSFQARSAFKSKNGNLYFGRRGTFISFHPDSIVENPQPPKVLITDFKINNQSVKVGGKSVLKENIEEATHLELNYNESSFSFSFAATDLVYPERNQYAYRLENFENWVYSGNNNVAIYTNIPPGKYIFHVMASNQDGVWNEEGTILHILIRPPWWKSWIFRICISVFIIFIFSLWYYSNNHRITRDKRRLKRLVELRTEELNNTNILLSEQKEELLQHREELQIQSKALKAANTMLEEKRMEVENQNKDLSMHRDNLEQLVNQRTHELQAAKLKAEESDRLKSAFLANMSHEIRTPLNAIVGFSYFFSDQKLDAESRERYFKIIKSNSDALLVLIDDILDLSRIEAGQLQFKIRPLNALEFMEQLHEQFNKLIKPNLEFQLCQPMLKEPVIILSDPYRFKQILNNLLSNAFKFTESGTIQLGYFPPKDKFVTFYVKDTGIGIEPDKQDIIFQRFMKIEGDKSKLFSGTGLGLSISRRLAEALGGTIWVESEAGKGSTFYFTQPVSTATLSVESNSTSSISKGIIETKRIKIAVADDEADSLRLMLEFLSRRSIDVLSFRNGLEISEYFEKQTIPDVQLILMDIKMPVMDGYEAARRIRKRFPNIPIIAQTAYALSNEVEKMKSEGFLHIMTKPINFGKLSSIIDKL